MRTLIASIILFAVLIAIIIGNIFYINYATSTIRQYTEAITPGGSSEPVDALTDFWKTHKKYIALSVSYARLDSMCELIIKLENAHKTGNAAAIERNKELIFDDLDGITRFEKISIENIF